MGCIENNNVAKPHVRLRSCHGREKMLVNAVVILESTQKRIFGWQIIQVEAQNITEIVCYCILVSLLPFCLTCTLAVI